MRERISILEEIKRGGYEASLITTYNAFLPFYEDVVLRKLIGQGVRHNVLMMDAAQCSQSVKHNPPRLAGRYYSLLPIPSSGAFHPKVVLLVGKSNGAVLVGSHNLTLSGFGYNREITNLIRIQDKADLESKALIQNAWQQVLQWARNQESPLPDHLVEMIDKLKDFAPWLSDNYDPVDSTKIISSQADERSLWNQFRPLVNGKANRVIVSGAFFDSELSFLKRIQEDLQPKEFVVGVDPETVHMPSRAKVEGISFVDARKLGGLPNKEDQHGYLHAKSIYVRTEQGESLLATGSANPSAPAWLRSALSGNTEMMLVQIGEEAEAAAKELGLLQLPKEATLSELDWQQTELNWQKQYEKDQDVESSPLRIALATDHDIRFSCQNSGEEQSVSCRILSANKVELLEEIAKKRGQEYILTLEADLLAKASYVQVAVRDKTVLYLVHHQSQIEEHSRTGSQRRFREALSSLNTETPDIETLISCVDKIIFASSDGNNQAANQIRQLQARAEKGTDTSEEGAELSTDISETRKAKKKYRIRQSDDLAYLLDVLIYHLRLEAEGLDATHEQRDAKGRSEEEQVGADDEDESRHDGPSEEEVALRTLALCHSKVKVLTGRMISQLNALPKGQVTFYDVIIRLTGVLAVLRQLRNCDGKVAWVKQGQTAFPTDERRRLFDAVVNNLFEAPNSILYPDTDHPDLAESDEIARLRGLLLWLAWDSGIQFIEKKPLFEERAEEEARIHVRALMLALAQLLRNDEVVMEEARQTIAPLCSSDMDWLNWMFTASKALEEFKGGAASINDAAGMKQGDIAFLKNLPNLGVRVVLSTEGDKAYLAFFDSDRGHRKYQQKAMRSMPMAQLS